MTCEAVSKVVKRPFAEAKFTPATERVATLAAQGYSIGEIAVKAGMSVAWVNDHLRLVLSHYGLSQKRQLTRLMCTRLREAATR